MFPGDRAADFPTAPIFGLVAGADPAMIAAFSIELQQFAMPLEWHCP